MAPLLNALSSARPHLRTRSRWRLFVLQVLMLSLFVTLLTRLFYLQVPAGADFKAQASDQSLREVVTQPTRGLIVDDMGRTLVANRSSWVVGIDRTLMAKTGDAEQDAVFTRLARVLGVNAQTLRARSLLCGDPGSVKGTCWNGSPYQPVPVAKDVSQKRAVRILEQAENFPGVVTDTTSLRSYPSPYGVNAAHLLGYLSPVTETELDNATKSGDKSLNGASVVGRAGVEKSYDSSLRGMPGYKRVAVDSAGRVLGEDSEVASKPGDTLVTSLDAKVQSVTEKNLDGAIQTARKTFDKVSGRNYEADSGAAVVMDAHTGRIVSMASQPTYDPEEWVGGISQKQLDRLYSKKSDDPLLSRATQGLYAPGSTWKPVMTIGAFRHGYGPDSRLNCSSGLQVGNRWFKNYESESYGSIGFDRALQISCDTFFYRVGLGYWQKYGSDPADVNAKDPLVEEAKLFGFGKKTGIDVPGEASGRIADRKWKAAYYAQMKSYYCKRDKADKGTAFERLFAHEFCLEGNLYRAGDAVNFSIGQGDTQVTPLQLARAYAAIANGGTLYAPRVAKAIVSPDGKQVRQIPPEKVGTVKGTKALEYVDDALKGTTKVGTLAWKFTGFPLDAVQVRGKTGSAEVQGKQSSSWVATYNKDYVVIMLVTQGGTGSGTSGPFVRKIWESLYGIDGEKVGAKKTDIPGVSAPKDLPVFSPDGAILPPVSTAKETP
ncbi:penicillin-binding protein 2 [Marmoricola endophyticus]|uniref:Penicillin-binding protein 2 n=1 Tax=Marmoricola endophyticus TaxID=2040280 RepID=A0A917BVQ8_9ACTN|nr:penicillin-binding protein 2 [Marmoricola endophyticus]GGF58138.1 penicillin-binding protein 2 [Marmoricola endophyticus]